MIERVGQKGSLVSKKFDPKTCDIRAPLSGLDTKVGRFFRVNNLLALGEFRLWETKRSKGVLLRVLPLICS
jgi:hypothetical protein